MKTVKKLFLPLILFVLVSTSAFAQSNLQDLVGDKATYLDQTMRDRGYNFISTSKSDDSAYQNWFNRSTNTCVTIRVSDGRVQSVSNTPLSDCGVTNNSNYYNKGYNKAYNKNSGGGNFNYGYLNNQKATYAYSELRNNGFDEQKTHQQGGNTYKLWYSSSSNQCLKTTSRNEKISSIVVSTNCK